MKKSFSQILLSISAAVAAVSCHPDVKPVPEPGPEPEKTVPIEQTFNVKSGDIVNVEFESYAAWTASSDVEWIAFSPAKGEAGDSSVECTVGAQKPSFEGNSEGHLTITVEGKAYKMTFLRESIARATRFSDADGDPIEELVFDANAEGGLSVQITVEANYYWDLDRSSSPWPSWIVDPGRTYGLVGEDGIYRKTFSLNINEAEAGDTDKSGEITFIDLEDESYKKTLAVKFIAKVIPDDPFEIKCDLGTEIHINPATNAFRDKDGNDIAGRYWLDFTVDTEDLSTYKIVMWEARAYNQPWQSSANLNNNYFGIYAPDPNHPEQTVPQPTLMQLSGASLTDPTNPKAFSLFVTSGAQTRPISINAVYKWNMGYLMFVPEKVWKDYAQYADSREFFSRMFMGGALNNKLGVFDPENNSEVNEIKENLRKYAIRIYVDKE